MAENAESDDDLTAQLAAGVNKRGITLAYGDKQTLDGVDVIPVAFVTYGFGGIEGSAQFGDGGGGGGMAIPLGAYVGEAGRVRFRPNSISALAVAIPLISALGAAIALIVRSAKGPRPGLRYLRSNPKRV